MPHNAFLVPGVPRDSAFSHLLWLRCPPWHGISDHTQEIAPPSPQACPSCAADSRSSRHACSASHCTSVSRAQAADQGRSVHSDDWSGV
eukprot:3136496-Rhodomonas_salina.4